MAKRALCLLLALAAVFSLAAPAFAEEEPVTEPEVTEGSAVEPKTAAATSGTCGDNVQWSLSNGTLTISGTGVMWAYQFEDRDDIKTVVIQNGVTDIGERAFADCTALTSVTIPASVTDVEPWAFSGCTALKAVTLPSGVTTVWPAAFENCTALESVTIPNSVTRIGDEAFMNCAALTGIKLPSGLTDIEYSTFEGCASLKSVTIPGGVTDIGEAAFRSCTALTSVTIPASVTAIGGYAFCDCSSLTGVTIPAGVTRIGQWAFFNCTSLTSVTIPASVTNILDGAFEGCEALTSVTVENAACEISTQWSGVFGDPETAVIHGYTGSTAEAYAKQYGYKFESLGAAAPTATPKPAATPVPKLAAPTVKIERVAAGIKVSWNKVSGAPRYMVYYKEGSGGWKKIGTTTSTTYTRKAANLKNGTTYAFTVRCCANDKKTLLSSYKASNSLQYTVQLAAPTVKIAKAANGIKVTWNKITGSPRYMVYYKEGSGGWKKIGTTTATTYTRAAKYLKNNVTYYFTVRCCAADKKTLLSSFKASNSLKYKK